MKYSNFKPKIFLGVGDKQVYSDNLEFKILDLADKKGSDVRRNTKK
jgi:hypothetical protein